jgi:hypothetical protein
MMCRNVKCFSSIMKSRSSSDVGRGNSTPLFRVNRRKFVHLLSIGRVSFTETPKNHFRWTSLIFVLCSRSAKSSGLNLKASTRSISTCGQFLIICEEVSNVVIIRKATNVTSFGSILSSKIEMCRSFNFLRRNISLCKWFDSSLKFSCSVWIFREKRRIHFKNSVKDK